MCTRQQTNNVEQTLPTYIMDPSHAEQQEEVQPPEGNVPDLELLQNPSKTTNVDENAETRRVHELTEKGQGAFIEKRDKFYHDLEALWSNLESQLLENDQAS